MVLSPVVVKSDVWPIADQNVKVTGTASIYRKLIALSMKPAIKG
jgi:hypothetical protein